MRSVLQDSEPGEFKPFSYYQEDVDHLEAYWDNCDHVTKWLNNKISICIDVNDESRIVGVHIYKATENDIDEQSAREDS